MSFDIRENIKMAIRDRCFTQSGIARKAHMSPTNLSLILNKKRRLEANELYDLCEAMEMSADELRNYCKQQLPDGKEVG